MGGGRFDADSYATYSSSIAHTTTAREVFTRTKMATELDPKGVAVRESRDSADNPQSTAAIFAIDQTGSMGMLAHTIIKNGLGVLFNELYDRKPITDPHLMFMAFGDVETGEDDPLQVSQFEADNRIVDQLKLVHIVGAGGGNAGESYNLAWYFAGMHTSIDCFEKRGKKGYLFTVGDEPVLNGLTRASIERVCGEKPERDLSNEDLLQMAQRMYHVFHVIVEEGSHMRGYPKQTEEGWRNLLGQNVLMLKDHTKLAEVCISAIEVTEGRDKAEVVASWKGKGSGTDLVVARAIGALTPVDAGGAAGGVTRL